MVKLGPPISVFDGLDLSKPADRVIALTRLRSALEFGEAGLLESVETAKVDKPSSAQCSASWMAIATVSAGVRALARVMIEQNKNLTKGN